MFNLRKEYEGRKVERVNSELENALRKLEKLEATHENIRMVEDDLGRDTVLALCDIGLAQYVSEVGESGMGVCVRVERTMDGRCYFSERWRDGVERYAPAIVGSVIAGLFTIAGVIVGFWLGVTSGT